MLLSVPGLKTFCILWNSLDREREKPNKKKRIRTLAMFSTEEIYHDK
jgi:hypothetical protein